MTHVMVDLETMGKNADAPIVSIGAVAFDPNGGGGIIDGFYVTVDLSSSVKCGGGVIDPETVMWWLGQSKAAQNALTNGGELSIREALFEFTKWFSEVRGVELWGNGAAFDNVILSSAYSRLGISTPWNFWNDRCYRTVKNMFPDVQMDRTGTHHNAYDDAKSQALHLINIAREKGLEL